MPTIKHGAMLIPANLLEQFLDSDALRTLVRNEFYHTLEALRHYLSDGGTRPLGREVDMWIFAVAFDCHWTRWARRGVDYSSAILALIPDYALEENAVV